MIDLEMIKSELKKSLVERELAAEKAHKAKLRALEDEIVLNLLSFRWTFKILHTDISEEEIKTIIKALEKIGIFCYICCLISDHKNLGYELDFRPRISKSSSVEPLEEEWNNILLKIQELRNSIL